MDARQPLSLPRGSVRAALTLLLVLALVAALFVPTTNEKALDAFLVLTGIAVRDYFATRKDAGAEDDRVAVRQHDEGM